MHADSHRSARFPRVRLVHLLAPVALSVGLVVGGYMTLTDLADEIALTVKPLQSDAGAPATDGLPAPSAANTIAAS